MSTPIAMEFDLSLIPFYLTKFFKQIGLIKQKDVTLKDVLPQKRFNTTTPDGDYSFNERSTAIAKELDKQIIDSKYPHYTPRNFDKKKI